LYCGIPLEVSVIFAQLCVLAFFSPSGELELVNAAGNKVEMAGIVFDRKIFYLILRLGKI
jgi:hypothetical protein